MAVPTGGRAQRFILSAWDDLPAPLLDLGLIPLGSPTGESHNERLVLSRDGAFR